MRREEAEQEAAWRNANDERRARLEFYAFDASAGLVEDAWAVTMRLRRDAVRGAVRSPPRPRPAPAPGAGGGAARARIREPQPLRARVRERATVAPPPRRAREPVTADADELAPRLRPPFLGRLARLVGGTVIVVAAVWVGLITALAILIEATTPTGLAIYVAAVLVGFLAIALGFAIRRS